MQPLAGIKILDLSRVLAGPWCSQLLADMGAEVIKIEHPRTGDDTRKWGPPWAGEQDVSAYFLSANRGKHSVAIDISQPEGQALVRQLAAESDVLLENFKVGGLKKYGLDHASLKHEFPELIYCSITGFGQDGPYAHRAGYDFMIQAMGGLMSLTGQSDGQPGAGPMKVGVALTDIFTGMYAANAIMAALIARTHSKQGVHIDLSLLDVQVGVLANQALNYLTSQQIPSRLGNAHPNIVPYQAFAASDGHLILAIGNDAQFQRFCELAGKHELAQDKRFASNSDRVENRRQLIPLIEAIIRTKPRDYWLAALEEASVPCGPINDLEQVFADPQVCHRNMEIERRHQEAGDISLVSNPIRFDGEALNADKAPPVLGQDTRSVLSELGIDDDRLDSLFASGVIR